MKTAISLFDRSGIMLEPWLQAGFECHLYDLYHPAGETRRDDGMILHGVDLLHEEISPANHHNIEFVSAFPPCQHLTTTGAAWFKGKGLRKLAEGITLVAVAAEFCEAAKAPYLIENPVSTLSTYWRKPDYTFHPHDFTGWHAGDNYTKKTCLWVGNQFVMPPEYRAALLGKPDRGRIVGANCSEDRILTPRGFARAVFESNYVAGLWG